MLHFDKMGSLAKGKHSSLSDPLKSFEKKRIFVNRPPDSDHRYGLLNLPQIGYRFGALAAAAGGRRRPRRPDGITVRSGAVFLRLASRIPGRDGSAVVAAWWQCYKTFFLRH
jgi:hypothetical protein